MANCHNIQILNYGTFFDFPRGMYIKVGDRVAHLDCEFDDALDDFKDYYEVDLVVGATADDISSGAAFHRKHDLVHLGRLLVAEIDFDISRRKSIRSERLERLVEQVATIDS